MNLKDILAISGESGLFRFLAQGRNAIIVEHLETGKRQTASSSAKVSSLEEIAIFTDGEEIKLSIVFDRIWDKENGGPADVTQSSSDEYTGYFADVVPEYDRDRVYVSDIKKVINWYNLLHKLNLLVREEEASETEKDHDVVKEPEKKPELASYKNTGSKATSAAPPKTRKIRQKK
ncbi:MAG: DUF5606 domain-containing protein [Bacteroidales bacterium]